MLLRETASLPPEDATKPRFESGNGSELKKGSTLTTPKIHGAEWEEKEMHKHPQKLSLGL